MDFRNVSAFLFGALLVSACSEPASQQGVGFGDYRSYQSLTQNGLATVDLSDSPTSDVEEAPVDAVEVTPLDEIQADQSLPATPFPVNNASGLSSEQDFAVVSAQRDIEADAAKIAAARQQYQLVTPADIERPAETGPNIIAFALQATNPIGNKIYRRNPFTSARGLADGRCEAYRTPDVAQEAFLEAGGPERDKLGLDTDGDGYACNWDPSVYQSMVSN